MTTRTVRAPESRTTGSGPRALSVHEIVEVGLSLGVRDGFDSLSMRSLAKELGVTPMAIYHHVKNKEDLLRMLLDSVFAPVHIPPREFGSWKDRLREFGRRSNAALSPYPGLELIIFQVRPAKESRRLMNEYIQILREGGFSERQAMLGFSAVHAHALGQNLIAAQVRRGGLTSEDPDTSPDATDRLGAWIAEAPSVFRAMASDVVVRGLSEILSVPESELIPPEHR